MPDLSADAADPPARVVLSRKGFDASAGGHPNLILPGGRLLPLPIPESGTGARFAELRTPWGTTVLAEMRGAGIRRLRAGGREVALTSRTTAHVDPDLVRVSRHRPPGWRPAFGQAGAAQTVLARAGVGAGDLFLFFGWFRPSDEAAAQLGLPRRVDLHVLWGWLRVGAVISVAGSGTYGGLADHPHVVLPHRTNNTLYVAADQAAPGVAGAGVFAYHPDLVLTAPDAPGRARWHLPACLHPSRTTVLARHATRFGEPDRNGVVAFDARYQWQEFVAHATPAVWSWARELLSTHGSAAGFPSREGKPAAEGVSCG